MNKLPELLKLIQKENTDGLKGLFDQPGDFHVLVEELTEAYHEELSRKAKQAAQKRKAKKAEETLADIDFMDESDLPF